MQNFHKENSYTIQKKEGKKCACGQMHIRSTNRKREGAMPLSTNYCQGHCDLQIVTKH